jgi:hypothetical protein
MTAGASVLPLPTFAAKYKQKIGRVVPVLNCSVVSYNIERARVLKGL